MVRFILREVIRRGMFLLPLLWILAGVWTIVGAQEQTSTRLSPTAAKYQALLEDLDPNNPESISAAAKQYRKLFQYDRVNAEEGFLLFQQFHQTVAANWFNNFSEPEKVQALLNGMRFLLGDKRAAPPNLITAFGRLQSQAAAKLKKAYAEPFRALAQAPGYGIRFIYEAGRWQPEASRHFALHTVLRGFSFGLKDYLAFREGEEAYEPVIENNGLACSWDAYREDVMRWERFARRSNAATSWGREVNGILHRRLEIYFTGTDNTPGYDTQGKLDERLRKSYRRFLGRNRESTSYSFVQSLYENYGKQDFYLSFAILSMLSDNGFETRFLYAVAERNEAKFHFGPLKTETDTLRALKDESRTINQYALETLNAGLDRHKVTLTPRLQIALLELIAARGERRQYPAAEQLDFGQLLQMAVRIKDARIMPFLIANVGDERVRQALVERGEPGLEEVLRRAEAPGKSAPEKVDFIRCFTAVLQQEKKEARLSDPLRHRMKAIVTHWLPPARARRQPAQTGRTLDWDEMRLKAAALDFFGVLKNKTTIPSVRNLAQNDGNYEWITTDSLPYQRKHSEEALQKHDLLDERFRQDFLNTTRFYPVREKARKVLARL